VAAERRRRKLLRLSLPPIFLPDLIHSSKYYFTFQLAPRLLVLGTAPTRKRRACARLATEQTPFVLIHGFFSLVTDDPDT